MARNELESKLLDISRLLSPENQAELLACVRLAYSAETSVRKSLGAASAMEDDFKLEPTGVSLSE
jgi:hypothetical protein